MCLSGRSHQLLLPILPIVVAVERSMAWYGDRACPEESVVRQATMVATQITTDRVGLATGAA